MNMKIGAWTARLAVGMGLWLLAAPGAVAQQHMPPTTGQIYVAVDPAGATVSCNGKVVDAPPVTISGLQPGEHLIVVSKLGHEEVRRTVELAAGQRVNLEIKLVPLTGLVLVQSNPEKASVEVDGAYRGETPLLIHDLPLGKYRAKVSMPGYLPKEVDLNVENRSPRRVMVDLVSDMATLDLRSQPEGARVVIGGVYKGETPCVADRIPEGEITIEFTKEGHEPHRQTVKVVAGEKQAIEAILAPIPARLAIVSIPAGARVYVNNQFRGVSPVKMTDLAPGTYRVRAELDGCSPLARDVQLGLAQDLVEEFRLESNTGLLEITTEPADVAVIVDAKEAGHTVAKPSQTDRVSEPFRLDTLAEGRHEIQLTKKGYFAEGFAVEIVRGKTETVHKKLNKRFIPDCEVVTKTAMFRGVLVEAMPSGDLKLEVSPGVVRTISAAEVRFRRPIRQEESQPTP